MIFHLCCPKTSRWVPLLSRLSVFRKSHVASFQGRVGCRFYPLEGLTHSTTETVRF